MNKKLDLYLLWYKKKGRVMFVWYENESDALNDFGKTGMYITHFIGTKKQFYTLIKDYEGRN